MHDNAIVRIVAKVLIPSMMLFAFYVQFHGDFGPGGGFQAGVIFAAAFILHSVVFGINRTRHVWRFHWNMAVLCLGVLLYGGVGLLSFFFDANYLNYSVLGQTPIAGQHLGILLVELGVGMCVAATMVMLFLSFAGRATHRRFVQRQERESEHNG